MYELSLEMDLGSYIQNHFTNFIYNYLPEKEPGIQYSVFDCTDRKALVYVIHTDDLLNIFKIGSSWSIYLILNKMEA